MNSNCTVDERITKRKKNYLRISQQTSTVGQNVLIIFPLQPVPLTDWPHNKPCQSTEQQLICLYLRFDITDLEQSFVCLWGSVWLAFSSASFSWLSPPLSCLPSASVSSCSLSGLLESSSLFVAPSSCGLVSSWTSPVSLFVSLSASSSSTFSSSSASVFLSPLCLFDFSDFFLTCFESFGVLDWCSSSVV